MANQNTFIPALERFNQYLLQREERIETKDKERKMQILSTSFIQKLQSAKTTEEISNITLKSNQIASATGIPELANLINNYARVKQTEISAREEIEANTANAEAMYNILKDKETIIFKDGKSQLVKILDLPAAQDIKNAPKGIQPQLYKQLLEDNEISTQIGITEKGKNQFGFSVEKINKKTGDYVIANQYAPYVGDDGTLYYDDELTLDDPNVEGIQNRENVREPVELSEFKMKRNLEIEDQKRAASLRGSNENDAGIITVLDDNGQNIQVYARKTSKGYLDINQNKIIPANKIQLGQTVLTSIEQKDLTKLTTPQTGIGSVIGEMAKTGKNFSLLVDDKFTKQVEEYFPNILKDDAKVSELKLSISDLIPLYDEIEAIPESERTDLQKKFLSTYSSHVNQLKIYYEKTGIRIYEKPTPDGVSKMDELGIPKE